MESLNRILEAEKRAEKIVSEAREEARRMKESSQRTIEAGLEVVKRECSRSGNKYKKDRLEEYEVKAVLFDEETERIIETERKRLSRLEDNVIECIEKAVLGR